MVAYVFKRRRKKDGKVVSSKSYYGRIKLEGDFVEETVCLHTSDKQVANAKILELVKEKEREKAGIIAPKKQRTAAKQSIISHLEDFIEDLRAIGRSKSYIGQVNRRVRKIVIDTKWQYPADVNADQFTGWRTKQTDLAPKTLNDYLDAFNVLMNWLVRQERINNNPLLRVTKAETKGKQQQRRAFKDEEFLKLISVATQQRCLYLTAAYTGLRQQELAKLVWADLDLKHDRPHMKVRASTTKNSEKATLPLHPVLVKELRKHRPASAKNSDYVFSGTQHDTCARRFAKDMAKAKIERIDAVGRKLDFHCLRYTFATLLARNGVSQRLAQELMRHSDPRLTANIYTDTTLLPTFEAVHELPWIGSSSKKGTVKGTLKPVSEGQNVSSADAEKPKTHDMQVFDFEGDKQGLSYIDKEGQMVLREGLEPSRR